MAAAAARPKPKGSTKPVRKTRYTCPACGNVALFTTGEVMQCPACGHYASDDEPLVPVADLATPVLAPATPTMSQPPRDPPTALAVAALVCGVFSLIVLWGSPLSLLLAIAAVAVGSVTLSQNEGDGGVQAMAVIGVVMGGLALLGILLFASIFWGDSSDWDWDWDWGWWDAPEEPRNNDGINVGIPGPSALVALAALVGTAWSLRHRRQA